VTKWLWAASALLAVAGVAALAQKPEGKVFRLWEGDAPGAQGKAPADIPTLTLYTPPAAKQTGAAVIVCPGGGYGGLAEHENYPIARWLNSLGITAAVLTYRLGPRYHHPVMQNDVNRAVRFVRAHAAEWKVDAKHIGIIGFSAGGHLASTAATHFDEGDANAADPIDRVSSRPDAAILVYPVITMTDPFTHAGSRTNLLGEHPTPELIDLLSNEKQVTPKTPPCFLVQGTDDTVVPAENGLLFTLACRKAGVPVELHQFAHGPHGFGLGGNDPILRQWPGQCADWLKGLGFLKKDS
jgi:acetyl esterase/lipase